MRMLPATILCLAVMGLSAPSFAQYGGYGYGSGDGRRGSEGYGERRRGDEDGYRERRRDSRDDYREERRGGGGQARGSFAATCRDIDQRGPSLSASCRTTRGDYVSSQINVERCGGRPIANQNGRLTC